MMGAAVVPEGDGVRAPSEPEDPFVAGAMIVEELKDAVALGARELVDVG